MAQPVLDDRSPEAQRTKIVKINQKQLPTLDSDANKENLTSIISIFINISIIK
jgi:hypothetical protein